MPSVNQLLSDLLMQKKIAGNPNNPHEQDVQAWKRSREIRAQLKSMGVDPSQGGLAKGTSYSTAKKVVDNAYKQSAQPSEEKSATTTGESGGALPDKKILIGGAIALFLLLK